MSAIDEGIVREFFEQNGFFVRQVRKYQVQARKKTSDEEIDLDNDKYVVVTEANKAKGSVRVVAHAKCVQKENRGSREGEVQ